MHWITPERPKIGRMCPWLIDRRFDDIPLHTLARTVRGAECGQLHLAHPAPPVRVESPVIPSAAV